MVTVNCDGLEIPQLLLDFCADINLTQKGLPCRIPESALHIAAHYRYLDVLKFLVDRGADVHFGTKASDRSMSALHRVVYELDVATKIDRRQLRAVVTFLVNQGVDVDCVVTEGVHFDLADRSGMTPLMMAASIGCVDAVQVFLDCGADVNF